MFCRTTRFSSSALLVRLSLAAAAVMTFASSATHAQGPVGTGVTYQGRLTQNGSPISGTADLRFSLFDGPNAGAALIAGPLAANGVVVSNGVFTVTLDFGPGAFNGDERWLGIEVDSPSNGGAGPFTTLTPRQNLAAAPYALFALGVNGAAITNLNASNLATGTVPSARIAGAYGSAVNFSNAGNTFTGAHSGSGAALTALNANNISAGTLPIARGGTGATTAAVALTNLNAQQRVTGVAPANSYITAINADGTVVTSTDQNSGGDITAVTAGTGMAGGGSSGAVTLNIAPNGVTNTLLANDALSLNKVSGGAMSNSAGSIAVLGNQLLLNGNGPDGLTAIHFWEGGAPQGETFMWDDVQSRFELTDDLAINGLIRTGDVTAALEGFNHLDIIGSTGVPTGGQMQNAGDLYVRFDIEAGNNIYVGNELHMNAGLPDSDQFMYFSNNDNQFAEFIQWDDIGERFVMSNHFFAQGPVDSNGGFNIFPEGFLTIDTAAIDTFAGGLRSHRDVRIQKDIDNDNTGAGGAWFTVATGNAIAQMRIEGGDEASTLFDGAVTANGIDYAEAFKVSDESIAAGDVVALTPGDWERVDRAGRGYESLIVGVVSTRPAFLAGMSFDQEEAIDPALTAQRDAARTAGDLALERQLTEQMIAKMKQAYRPVALVGRVPCKVDAQYGAIRAGDRLTASPTPGHAMLQTQPGPSLGIALEDHDAGAGAILVFVQPGWHGVGTGGDDGGDVEPGVGEAGVGEVDPLGAADGAKDLARMLLDGAELGAMRDTLARQQAMIDALRQEIETLKKTGAGPQP